MYPNMLTDRDLIALHRADVVNEVRRYQLAACVRRLRRERSRNGEAVPLLPAPALVRVARALDTTVVHLARALDTAVAQLKCRLGYC